MKSTSVSMLVIFLSLAACSYDKSNWKMSPVPIQTKWSAKVDPLHPWPEYPRPQMKRKEWKNLNGLWDYAITPKKINHPDKPNGKILVPYPVESALSGVKKLVGKDSLLWYFRHFTVPESWKGNRILLHFEAVDWETSVFINGKSAGKHKGGYDPFSMDITELLSEEKKQELLVSVWDPTDSGTQPRGKQVYNPHGIWYTSTTGIWQTVWLEPVPETYLESFRLFPDIDCHTLTLTPRIKNAGKIVTVKAFASYKGKVVGKVSFKAKESGVIHLDELHKWSPSRPSLYDLKIQLMQQNKVIDETKSYFGMRSITLERDKEDQPRIFINNQFLFQQGPLDQGFWPGGLYTPPTEAAMVYDLKMIKEMGFNMLRKHVKVESRRFYYWCDKMGLLVWQDMPSGDAYIGPGETDIHRTDASAKQFKAELVQLIQTKFNHPSIIIWVPFNEGWGQFNTNGIVDFIRKQDSTRLINSASGWTDRGVGDMLDLHHYPEPICPPKQKNRAIVLGEFGGLGFPVPNHTWVPKNWGYQNMKDTLELLTQYENYFSKVRQFVQKGLSAAVYTQTTDVETETNGLMTYDRKPKIDTKLIFNANQGYEPPKVQNKNQIFVDHIKVVLSTSNPGSEIYYTLDGTEPGKQSAKYTSGINLTKTTTLKVKAFWPKGISSRTRIYKIEKVEPKILEHE